MISREIICSGLCGSVLAALAIATQATAFSTHPLVVAPLVMLWPAMLLAMAWRGRPAGVATLVVGGVLTGIIQAPVWSPAAAIILGVFVVAGIAALWKIDRYQETLDQSQQEASQAIDQQKMIASEMAHRLNNVLVVVQNMSRQVFGNTPQTEVFEDRLIALSHAHLLAAKVRETTTLHQLCETALSPFGRQFDIAGVDIDLGPEEATGLFLILHELATNAVKYGALSVPQGRVAIKWVTNPFIFIWKERGGPPTVSGQHTGFGTQLLNNTVAALGGSIERSMEPDGLRFEIKGILNDVPVPQQTEAEALPQGV